MPIDVSNTPDMYEINANGSFTFNTKVGVRNEPNMDATPIIYYEPGESVNYSQKLKNGNHLWLSYVAASGETHYVPYVNTDTGEYFGTDSNASVQPIVPPTGTGTETGELGSLTGQAGADVADQTPDGTTLTESGQFTFSEPAAGRASTDMDAAHLDSWSIGETVYYNAKIKADGHYWFQYVNTNGSTYYVPYATISPFRYYGTDANPGDPIMPQKTTTGGGQTEIARSHTGTDTGTPNLTSTSTRSDVGEMYKYPSVSSLTITSNAWGRDKPFMDPTQANQIHRYTAGTKIEYTHKLINDDHCWVILKDGQYLPVSTIEHGETTWDDKSDTVKYAAKYSYVLHDTGKHLPIHELSPYNYSCTGRARTDVEDWEQAYNIENVDSRNLPTVTSEEETAMQNLASQIDANADPDSVSIAFITDTHFDSWKTPATARVLRSMQLMSYYAKNYGVDLMINDGDMNDGVKPKDISEEDIARAVDAMKLGQRPYIILQGNHDDNSGYARDETNYNGDQVITNNEASTLRSNNFSQWLNIPSDNPNNAVFGTYDIPNSNVTVIVLDGFDMADYTNPTRTEFRHGHTDYSQAQQDWLQDTLNNIGGTRKIVLFDHISLAGIDKWADNSGYKDRYETTTTVSYQPGVAASRNIHNMLVAHQSEFHNILGFFAGHRHIDNNASSGGIQFIEATCGIADRGDGAKTRRIGDLLENAWEVIQINPTRNQVTQYRFGFSGPAFKQTWTM